MTKIIYLSVLLICFQTQATVGDAVDFVSQVAHEYSKERPKQSKGSLVAKQEAHPVEKLGRQFVNGFSKVMVPATVYVAYRTCGKLYHEKPLEFPHILKVTEQITLLGAGIGFGDTMNAVGTLMALDRVSFFDFVQALTHIAGSVTAIGLLVVLTVHK